MLQKTEHEDEPPAVRLVDLPEPVRKFLTDLRPEEIALLQQSIRFASAIMTVGRATRWVIIVMLGMVVGVVMFGESIQKIGSWVAK